MDNNREGSDPRQEGVDLLRDILDSPGVREHPEFVDAVAVGDDIDVTVRPKSLDQPVTIRLHVISAALVPHRPRRRRKPGM